MRGAGIAEIGDERRRLLRRRVGQAENGEIDRCRADAAFAAGFLRSSAAVRASSISGMAASRAWMPRPVVPDWPSMKIRAPMIRQPREGFCADIQQPRRGCA